MVGRLAYEDMAPASTVRFQLDLVEKSSAAFSAFSAIVEVYAQRDVYSILTENISIQGSF